MEGFETLRAVENERDRYSDEMIARTVVVCPRCGGKIALWQSGTTPTKFFTMCDNAECQARIYQEESFRDRSLTVGRWSLILRKKDKKIQYWAGTDYVKRIVGMMDQSTNEKIFPLSWDSQEDALLFLDILRQIRNWTIQWNPQGPNKERIRNE